MQESPEHRRFLARATGHHRRMTTTEAAFNPRSESTDAADLDVERIALQAIRQGFDGWRVAIALGLTPQMAARLLQVKSAAIVPVDEGSL